MQVQSEVDCRNQYFSQVVRNLSPAWFASVMGTGIFALASKNYACYWAGLNSVAVFLWGINILLFLGLIVPWIQRWFFYKDYALRDLNHPITGQFYATMPIGCLVLAADFISFGPNYIGTNLALTIAKGLWITGAVLSLTAAVIIPTLNYFNKATIEDINPVWFMPPVSLIVVPIAGASLIPSWPQTIQKVMLLINYISWGVGFFLFMFIAVICFYRLFVAPILPGSLIPTLWIYLGPIGAGTVSLLNLGHASLQFMNSALIPVLNILGLIYWSFGFWWLITASVITTTYILRNNLPYALSWWAYTFPLGAYTVATYLISINLECEEIRVFGFLCYCLLAFCWITVFYKTFSRVCIDTLLYIRQRFFSA
ncbi:putative membrane protein [Sporomusa ovata DSM 2662]|uniref:C4-dicarboxylate transporter/malic acid transport protein n=1 Tax=Sporomusa ovata TaxID=2378 RepID=A0A0U1L6L2_9FIRM|nr:C4-dicarboxylate transporter/malic acid transport protein [Sporomusa ovata]EQB28587.1 C4-dicarboxylate transporter/malic acid transport protein [Sporomusa ovata DSM 2662]CQR74919.1 C4-dicarboxylate transporter/malic acid transport protein [Sporomusa ovata]